MDKYYTSPDEYVTIIPKRVSDKEEVQDEVQKQIGDMLNYVQTKNQEEAA